MKFCLRMGCVLLLLVGGGWLAAQEDGLDLPTELYVLRNNGIVERYGLGAAGVEAITPDGAFVLDFAVAPDNGWLAYRTEAGIYITYMPAYPEYDALLLEETGDYVPPTRGYGDTMAWSPLGDALAYTTPYGARIAFNVGGQPTFGSIATSALLDLSWSPGETYLAVAAENAVWWIYRRQGTEMLLAGALPSSYGTAWLDDTRLIFAPGEGGLCLLDLANANAQSVILDASRYYRLPSVRPDGSIVVFSRQAEEPDIDSNSAYFQQLTYVNGVATVGEISTTAVQRTDGVNRAYTAAVA